MNNGNELQSIRTTDHIIRQNIRISLLLILRLFTLLMIALIIFYLSLVMTSKPVNSAQREVIDRAINLLEEKGFDREVFLLRHVTTFRSTDNWLNSYVEKESAFASTNCPFGVMTIYPDFYEKAHDDTERAMVLLHEAQHLTTIDEGKVYKYVWQNRHQLGWTQLTHGTTPTYITIALQTRDYAPALFTCPDNLWNDCTESKTSRPQIAGK